MRQRERVEKLRSPFELLIHFTDNNLKDTIDLSALSIGQTCFNKFDLYAITDPAQNLTTMRVSSTFQGRCGD